MDLNPDFRDLLQCLNAEAARFLVVGGYAVMFHTEPRYTKDLDVWIDPSPENAQRVFRALARFGAPIAGVLPRDLATPGNFFLIGRAPNRIDVITSIESVDFASAWENRVPGSYGDERISFLCVDDLVRNKRAVGRAQDLLDVEKLESWSKAKKRDDRRLRTQRRRRKK